MLVALAQALGSAQVRAAQVRAAELEPGAREMSKPPNRNPRAISRPPAATNGSM
jgi:hypothetical protein